MGVTTLKSFIHEQFGKKWLKVLVDIGAFLIGWYVARLDPDVYIWVGVAAARHFYVCP